MSRQIYRHFKKKGRANDMLFPVTVGVNKTLKARQGQTGDPDQLPLLQKLRFHLEY